MLPSTAVIRRRGIHKILGVPNFKDKLEYHAWDSKNKIGRWYQKAQLEVIWHKLDSERKRFVYYWWLPLFLSTVKNYYGRFLARICCSCLAKRLYTLFFLTFLFISDKLLYFQLINPFFLVGWFYEFVSGFAVDNKVTSIVPEIMLVYVVPLLVHLILFLSTHVFIIIQNIIWKIFIHCE